MGAIHCRLGVNRIIAGSCTRRQSRPGPTADILIGRMGTGVALCLEVPGTSFFILDKRPVMTGRWPLLSSASLFLCISGCANLGQPVDNASFSSSKAKEDVSVAPAAFDQLAHPLPASTPTPAGAEAAALGPDLAGPQPLDSLIRIALDENRTVRAARFNVMALKHRIPQVTALDDPVVSNTIFPIPSVAPQYSLMGYMPYSALLAQQFPWCGTLKLRGQAAEDDVRIALFELAATQLDVVASVKRAYHDLHYAERPGAFEGEPSPRRGFPDDCP